LKSAKDSLLRLQKLLKWSNIKTMYTQIAVVVEVTAKTQVTMAILLLYVDFSCFLYTNSSN